MAALRIGERERRRVVRDRSLWISLFRQAALFAVLVILILQAVRIAGWGIWGDIVTGVAAATLVFSFVFKLSTCEAKRYDTALRQLEVAEIDIVERLAKAAEFRDDATGGHVQRMSSYCGLLARLCQCSERDIDLIILASQMHDIGKIGIPDHILLKPGKLTPEERLIMESHVEIGARVLKHGDTPLVQMAYEIALTHHEKWDGTGYPNGLVGDEIPMVGRIAAMCDVFEALTCSRPYKRAWSFGEATKELLRQSGKHFDPKLVDVFMENIDLFKDMYNRNRVDTEPWKAAVHIPDSSGTASLFESEELAVSTISLLKDVESRRNLL